MFISGYSSIFSSHFLGLDFAFFFLLGATDLFSKLSHSFTEKEYALTV